MHKLLKSMANFSSDYIVGDLIDIFCEDLLEDRYLATEVESSMDEYTSQVCRAVIFISKSHIW